MNAHIRIAVNVCCSGIYKTTKPIISKSIERRINPEINKLFFPNFFMSQIVNVHDIIEAKPIKNVISIYINTPLPML